MLSCWQKESRVSRVSENKGRRPGTPDCKNEYRILLRGGPESVTGAPAAGKTALRIWSQTSVFADVWLRAVFIFRKCARRQLSVSQKREAHTKCEKGFGKPNMQASVWKTITNRPCLPSTEAAKSNSLDVLNRQHMDLHGKLS